MRETRRNWPRWKFCTSSDPIPDSIPIEPSQGIFRVPFLLFRGLPFGFPGVEQPRDFGFLGFWQDFIGWSLRRRGLGEGRFVRLDLWLLFILCYSTQLRRNRPRIDDPPFFLTSVCLEQRDWSWGILNDYGHTPRLISLLRLIKIKTEKIRTKRR